MTGYTPVFSSILDGTLYGKWPHNGMFALLLSQCDRRGYIDMVPAELAAKIGVPQELLLQCISDFMQPDPGSRTGDLDGRRLELIAPENRDWGWRVINHGIYRERARKTAYDAERTRSGKDAERKQAQRKAVKQAVPRSPAKSRRDPLSDSDSNSKSKRGNGGDRSVPSRAPSLTQGRFRTSIPTRSPCGSTTGKKTANPSSPCRFPSQQKHLQRSAPVNARSSSSLSRTAGPGSLHSRMTPKPSPRHAGNETRHRGFAHRHLPGLQRAFSQAHRYR